MPRKRWPTAKGGEDVNGAERAYACIKLPVGSMDVALTAGRSPSRSLRESAKELREKAMKDLDRAKIMEIAAIKLEKEKS